MGHTRIVVDIAGVEAVGEITDDGAAVFKTPNDYLTGRIERAANDREMVAMVPLVPYITYRAGWASALELAAALFAVDTAHTILVTAPREVERLFERAAVRTGPIRIA